MCKNQERHLLVDIYYQEDQFQNTGNVYIQNSFAETALESRIKILSQAKEAFGLGQDTFKQQVNFNLKFLNSFCTTPFVFNLNLTAHI